MRKLRLVIKVLTVCQNNTPRTLQFILYAAPLILVTCAMDASRNEEIISQWWNQLKHLIAHPRLLVLHEHLYFAALNAQNASTYGPTSSSLQVTEAIKFLSRTIEVQSDMTRSIVTEVQKFSRLIKEGDVTRDESIIDKMSFRMAISMISLAQKKRESNFGTVSSGSGLLVDILRNWTPQSAFLFPHLAHEEGDSPLVVSNHIALTF